MKKPRITTKISANIDDFVGNNSFAGDKGTQSAIFMLRAEFLRLSTAIMEHDRNTDENAKHFYKGVLKMKGITTEQGRQTLEKFKIEAANEVGVPYTY